MKIFSVSKACNACGECILRTALLTEDSNGFAVPAQGHYIQECDLPEAEQVAAQCPVNALSIIEQSSVTSKGKAGVEELAKVLEQRLMAVDIPDVSSRDIAYHEEDYTVDYGYISDEGRRIYPSERKAEEAGKTQFERMFWNRRADFVLSIMAQYKSKVMRKYYNLSEPDQTYYAEIGRKMESVLKEIQAEASYLAEEAISLSTDFTTFHPEMDDRDFKETCKAWYENLTASPSYVRDFCGGFERLDYCRKRDYESHIISESHQSFEYDKKGRQKTIFIYSFEGANQAGRDLVKDILFYVGCAESCSCRSIDDMTADDLNHHVLWRYRELVKKEIAKKIDEFKNAISKC